MQHQFNILNDFQSITLVEMERVKLMNRTDTKFAFSVDELTNFLNQIKHNYSVLEIMKVFTLMMTNFHSSKTTIMEKLIDLK